jgi:hypothetical protein
MLWRIDGGSVVSGKGWSGAQLQIVAAARLGVSRSGEGMFRPHLDTSGSDDSSSRGLQRSIQSVQGSRINWSNWRAAFVHNIDQEKH